MIAKTERQTYEDVWTGVDRYSAEDAHRPGLEYLPIFKDVVKSGSGSLLDAGCGDGRAGLAYQALGYQVTLLDVTRAGLVPEARDLPFIEGPLWAPIPRMHGLGGKFDEATCTDVLEHLPTQFTMLAVDQLLRAARRVFLSVALTPDVLGVWVGRPLHLTVQPFTWWRDSLFEVGHVIEARDLLQTGIFYVSAR